MKKALTVLVLVMSIFAESSAFALGNIILTEPDKTGGPTVLEAIANRKSGVSFADTREVPLKALSTILWAATGKNREPKGWTVPFAKGAEPYTSIYVINNQGAFLYSWEKHQLELINEDSKIVKRVVAQPGFENVPLVLVFTTKGAGPVIEGRAEIAAGAMAQNVYLATQPYGLKARFMQSFNKIVLAQGINLGPLSRVIGVMPIGY